LNQAFIANQIQFSTMLEYEDSTDIANGQVQDLHVRFLDHSRFQRRCKNVQDAYVTHCGAANFSAKMSRMKAEQSWRLKENWQDVPYHGFEAWIQDVQDRNVQVNTE